VQSLPATCSRQAHKCSRCRAVDRSAPGARSSLLTPAARASPPHGIAADGVGEPSFFPTLEAYASAPIVGGNRADLLLNGEQIFPACWKRSGARTHRSPMRNTLRGRPRRADLAEAMAERCRAGLGVNVLLDSFGALSRPRSTRTPCRARAATWRVPPADPYIFRRSATAPPSDPRRGRPRRLHGDPA